MQDLISLWEFLLMINILCSHRLLSTLQSNVSLAGIIETQGAAISAELPVYAELSFCTWYGWCNTLHDGWLKLFSYCAFTKLNFTDCYMSTILPCLGPSEVLHSFFILNNLNCFMSWTDLVSFLHSLLASLLLKNFIQVLASVVTVLYPLHPWHAHRNLKERWSTASWKVSILPGYYCVTVFTVLGDSCWFTGPNINL